jgi:hypothetical protein
MSPGFGSWRSWSPWWTICFRPILESKHQVHEPHGLALTIFFLHFESPLFLGVDLTNVLDGCDLADSCLRRQAYTRKSHMWALVW